MFEMIRTPIIYLNITYYLINFQMVFDTDGKRPAGKCFVEFASTADSDKALKKFGEKIGPR